MITNRNTDRTTIVERAAAALRHRLGPCNTISRSVTVDHERSELIVESRAAVLRLDSLIEQVRAAPEHRGQELIDGFIEAALAANMQLQAIRLDDWAAVEPRLRVRLRAASCSGPDATTFEQRPELEVVIDLPDAVIIPTARMLTAWNMPLDRVVAIALTNTRLATPERARQPPP